MVVAIDPKLLELSVEEKFQVMEQLWDSIPEENVPVPQFHRDILAERVAKFQANPIDAQEWEEVRKELEAE